MGVAATRRHRARAIFGALAIAAAGLLLLACTGDDSAEDGDQPRDPHATASPTAATPTPPVAATPPGGMPMSPSEPAPSGGEPGPGEDCGDGSWFAGSDDGAVRVIVTLDAGDGEQAIAEAQDRLIAALDEGSFEVHRQFTHVPQLALSVTRQALCVLFDSPLVTAVEQDRADPPTG